MGAVKTLHIVGYKNSGKTTLISSWIRMLKANGYRVAVIKHHGHGAKLSMPDQRKDSMRYLENGADTSIVSGGGYTQHMLHKELDFAHLMQLALEGRPDIVFVEGYKKETEEKVVLLRNMEDWATLQQLGNIRLVIGGNERVPYPQVDSREDTEALTTWLKDWLGN